MKFDQLVPTMQQILRSTSEHVSQNRRWYGRAVTVIFLLLSVLAIIWLIKANWASFVSYQWQIRPWWAVWAFLSFAGVLSLSASMWHILMTRMAQYAQMRYNLKFWAYANLAKRIPTPIWYIASRATQYQLYNIPPNTVALVSALELGLILISGLIVFMATLPFWVVTIPAVQELVQLPLLFILSPLSLLLLHPRLLGLIWQRLGHQSNFMQPVWCDTLIWVGAYLLIWVLGGWGLYCIVNVFHSLDLAYFPALLGVWAIANTVSLAGSLTLVNFGLREISVALLLTPLITPLPGLLAAITVRVMWLTLEFIGGIVSLFID